MDYYFETYNSSTRLYFRHEAEKAKVINLILSFHKKYSIQH